MKLAVAALFAGSAAAYQAPTMTFSLGKKKAAAAPVAKVSYLFCLAFCRWRRLVRPSKERTILEYYYQVQELFVGGLGLTA